MQEGDALHYSELEDDEDYREFGRKDIILKPSGERITRESLLNDAINYYHEAYSNNITEVCDFSEGSEIRTLHESFIVELFSLYKEMFRTAKMKFVLDSEGTYLDRLGCEVHLTRQPGYVAKGTVTFETTEAIKDPIIIPSGTVVLSQDDGEEYILESNVTLNAPNEVSTGIVHAKYTGSKYNKKPNLLTAFQNIGSVKHSVRVTNPSAITGGTDTETDDSFRARILQAKRNKAWGTISQYNDLLRERCYVHDVQFVEPELLLTGEGYAKHLRDDGTNCTDCTRVVFVNGFDKPCKDEVIQSVEYNLSLQNNLVIGQLFHVEKAKLQKLYFRMELWTSQTVSEATIYNHLQVFFDGGIIETKRGDIERPGLNIHESVTKNELLNVLEDIPGVEQVGGLWRLKYNGFLTASDNFGWVDNGDNSYSWTDDYGYTFSRKNSTVDHWGWINFSKITPVSGTVLTVDAMSNVDNDTQRIFDIDQRNVDEKK